MIARTLVTPMPTMPTALGTLIANERERLGWSLRDIAAHGGPSYNTISYIERGDTAQPDAATLWKIAVAFAAGGGDDVGRWFARLLRVAGYPLDAQADEVIGKLVSTLSSKRRQLIIDMTAEDLDMLLSLWTQIRGGAEPPQ